MKRTKTPTPSETFAFGWNARCAGKSFDVKWAHDAKLGWQAANRVPEHGRVPFNAPVSRKAADIGFADRDGFMVTEDVQRAPA